MKKIEYYAPDTIKQLRAEGFYVVLWRVKGETAYSISSAVKSRDAAKYRARGVMRDLPNTETVILSPITRAMRENPRRKKDFFAPTWSLHDTADGEGFEYGMDAITPMTFAVVNRAPAPKRRKKYGKITYAFTLPVSVTNTPAFKKFVAGGGEFYGSFNQAKAFFKAMMV